MDSNAIIEISDLHVRYGGDGGETALQGINLSIAPGERVAIIGRSGGGKSTLLRVLSGLVSPTSGYARMGEQILGPDGYVDRSLYDDVGLVFQNYGLVPQLTAMQNVLCGRLNQSSALSSLGRFPAESRTRARQLLEDLGLGDRLHMRSSRLSGGEQQRVAIARLLLQAPPIMLLDEPVASLDIHWASHAIRRISASRDGNTTLVMVLHDMPMARKFADRVICIHNGEIIFDGDPDEGCRRLEALEATSTDGTLRPAFPLHDLPELTPPPSHKEPPPIGGLEASILGRSSFYIIGILAAIALYIWAAVGVEFSLSRVFGNLDHAADFIGRMLPPDLSITKTIAASLLETVQMALIGTTLAAFISLPLAVMAARNITSPTTAQTGGRRFSFPALPGMALRTVSRLILNLLRTIPSIIWGLFFVAIVGLGPFPGILALTFYASGYLGKFYYEGIESIDPKPLQSLRTVGATPFQSVRWGVFPQVLPLMLGYTLYMFEYNVRAASILGIVGAGGIGFYLYTYINNFQYDRAATALLLLLVVVTIVDYLSSTLRARLMD